MCCNYIKDNGEQCGMDAEPFCRHHDDTEQAEEWRDEQREAYGAVSGASAASNHIRMESVCEDCGSHLRRCERLTEHPHHNRRVQFEAYVECDCDEYTLGVESMTETRLPEGWL